jgi:hypothetical protein
LLEFEPVALDAQAEVSILTAHAKSLAMKINKSASTEP